MNAGFWAGDAIAQAMDKAVDDSLHQAKVRRLERRLDQAASDNAANYAEKRALRLELGKLAPDHPLVINQAFRVRIHNAAVQALAFADKISLVGDAACQIVEADPDSRAAIERAKK